VPATQLTQLVEPVLLWYVPAAHEVQAGEPAAA
jgi:hypothetical protein